MKDYNNKNKKNIIIITSVLLFFIFLASLLTIYFHSDKKYEKVLKGSDYANQSIETNKLTKEKIKVNNKVFGKNIKINKTIEVVENKDDIKIKLNGKDKTYVCPNKKYQDEGYKLFKNGKEISDKVEVKSEENKIIYKYHDKFGNYYKIRELIYEDKEKPEIKLNGNKVIYLNLGQKYNDQGVSFKDNCDDLNEDNLEIKNNINYQKPGTYKIEYILKDKSGNINNEVRIIHIKKKEERTPKDLHKKGIVYLTFDDGPKEGTTNKILDILKEENVKASFFVTGRGPDYLIKREHDEGHQVLLHTYTHDYKNVYSSMDSYFKDLEKIENRVYKITGIKPMIIRFPGGTSNTVSRRYNKGIMTRLSKEVEKRGYKYCDWNVSSGDAGQTSNPKKVYQNVTSALRKDRINIVLMHDIHKHTMNAIRDIIKYCKRNNYEFRLVTYDIKMVHHGINN